jgi:ferredoxin-fold anticodon binding domain-containing protein
MIITDRVRRTSINWVLAMQKQYGQDVGLKCFDVMRQTFGEELVGSVMFGIIEGVRGDQITIRTTANNLIRKIEAIKEIRHISGMGLKEAKDAVEDACFKDVSVLLSHEMLKEENSYKLDQAIRVLEMSGVTVF